MVLGIRVQRDRVQRRILIDQSHYVRNTLKEFQYEDCKPVSTPADGYEHLQATTQNDADFQDIARYQRAIGQLNWLVRGTRPDIAFVTHRLSQHCQKPTNRHWAGVHRVLRYLQQTKDLTLRYDHQREEPTLFGYSDSDFASDTIDRRSTMGYAFLLGGAAITWASRKQQSISTSTTEAEYVRLCNTAKEAV
jgi:hypothetical protein